MISHTDDTHPRAWLEKNGFTDENLCAKVQSKRIPWVLSTAMYEAAAFGEMKVCKFLRANGAAGTIRTTVNRFSTPLLIACEHGHLDVAHWLLLHGAADADLQGDAALDGSGSCSGGGGFDNGKRAALLLDQVGAQAGNLRAALAVSLRARSAFVDVVVPAVSSASGRERAHEPKANRHRSGRASALGRLAGHEQTLLALVADFAGVARGRRLRRLREAHDLLAASQ